MRFIQSKLALLLLFILPAAGMAQDDSNDRKPVEFLFGDKTFKQTLPFDQIFSIRFKDIPATINALSVIIYEYDDKKLREIKGPGEITEETFNKSAAKYIFGPKPRMLANDTYIEIGIPLKLKPNRDYLIEIKAHERERQLSDSAKDVLTEHIKNSAPVTNLFKQVVKKTLENPAFPSSELNPALDDFAALADLVVKQVNPDYVIKEQDRVAQLTAILVVKQQVTEITEKIKEIEVNINNVTKNKPELEKALKSFNKELPKVKWETLVATDDEYKKLEGLAKAVKSKIDSAEPLKAILNGQLDNIMSGITQIIDAKESFASSIAVAVAAKTVSFATTGATYRADFLKNAKLYVTLDAGMAYTWRIDRVLFYTGTNIYFRPVNKNIPLSHYKRLKDYLAVRTSLLLGVTFTDFEKPNVRKGLIGNSALVVGLGFRINPFLKLNGGTMVYYRYSENPAFAADRNYTTFSPFVSLSLDLDVKSLVGGIGAAIFK